MNMKGNCRGRWYALKVAVFVSVVSASALLLMIVTAGGSPRLSFTPADIDLGRLEWGEVAEGTVTLENTGTAALQLIRIQPSCGCTGVSLSRSHLLPGENASLQVRFDARGGLGLRREQIQVLSNDPGNAVVQIGVIALVSDVVGVEPPVVDFGVIDSDGLPAMRSVVLSSPLLSEGMPVAVSGVSESCFEYSLSSTDSVGQKRLTVTLKPTGRIGPVSEDVTLSWGGTRTAVVRVPARAFIQGPGSATPHQLLLNRGVDSAETVLSEDVVVTGPPELSAAIREVVVAQVREEKGRYVVTVTRTAQGHQSNYATGRLDVPIAPRGDWGSREYVLCVPVTVVGVK